MEKTTVPISALSPSASRLLLALLSTNEIEEMDQTIQRAGIRSLDTHWRAKQQLLEGGYLHVQGGRLKATLKPR